MAFSKAVAMVVSIAPLLPAPFASDAIDEDEAGFREGEGSSPVRLESPFCLQHPDELTGTESVEWIRL
jgi:hypothetical protein